MNIIRFYIILWWLIVAMLLAALALVVVRVMLQGTPATVGITYALPVIAVLLASLLIRLKFAELMGQFTLSIMATGLAILVAETVLLSQDPELWERKGIRDSQLRSVEAFRDKGHSAHINLFPKGLVKKRSDGRFSPIVKIDGNPILPLGGISNSVIIKCLAPGSKWQTFEADRYGFPNPPDVWEASRTDIMVVGDSHVEGWCVPTKNSFVGLLREHHPDLINVAAAGNGPLADLAALMEYGPAKKPRRIIWFHTAANDFSDLNRELQTPILRAYLEGDQSQGLISRQPEIDNALIAFAERRMKQIESGKTDTEISEVLNRFLTLYHIRQLLRIDRGSLVKPKMLVFRKILEKAEAVISEWDGELIVVYLPSLNVMDNGGNPQTSEFSSMMRKLGISYVDVTLAFKKYDDIPALFAARVGTHFSPEGHAVVARKLLLNK